MPCGGDAAVAVRFAGEGWPSSLERDTREDLRAGLRVRGIELCGAEADQRTESVATIVMHWRREPDALVSVEVQDTLTNKRVLRDLPLQPIAQDARALALAQAADELLRASWVELRLHDAPEPVRPLPEVVERAVELPPRAASATSSTKMLGARFASEIYGGGLKLFGADAYVAFWLAPRLGFSVALGVRSASKVRAQHGSIDASALTASAGLMLPLLPRESRLNLVVSTVGHVGELALTGRGDGKDVRSQSQMAIIASARIELGATLRLTDALQVELSFGPGVSLRAASAIESSRVATEEEVERVSSRGLELHGTLGVGGLL